MKKVILFIMFILNASFLLAKINVVTSSQDLKSIAEYVGGNLVEVYAIAPGNFDLHTIEPRPSMVLKLKKADMVVKIGLDLDMWMDSLISASRNKNILYGKIGYVDASVGIDVLEKPQGKVDASMGDIHIFGNPHYWLDPVNGKIIAKNICDGLKKISPENSQVFETNLRSFNTELDKKLKEWTKKMEEMNIRNVVFYHNSWIYFAKRFNLNIVDYVEPKPGIPPTSKHLDELIKKIKENNVKLIIMDNFYPEDGPRFLASKTQTKVVKVPSSVYGENEAKNYFELFDYIISSMEKAVKE